MAATTTQRGVSATMAHEQGAEAKGHEHNNEEAKELFRTDPLQRAGVVRIVNRYFSLSGGLNSWRLSGQGGERDREPTTQILRPGGDSSLLAAREGGAKRFISSLPLRGCIACREAGGLPLSSRRLSPRE